MEMQESVLALTDLSVLPTSAVFNAVKMINNEGVGNIDPQVITQASLLCIVRLLSYELSSCVYVFSWLGNAFRDV